MARVPEYQRRRDVDPVGQGALAIPVAVKPVRGVPQSVQVKGAGYEY